ncbi:interleukin-23 receptor [Tupaia chinensis]|uniref:interleukin-23 receptor n=1 Tax=Tupaia chinensis TaxID=246437 RepID=UPI0003C8D626|nr:interleukin-23 receptor [Tupaia chinensis]
MNQVQWDVVIGLYILFSWCHGGITNIKCSGHIWIEPATVFKMGMNISVYCQAAIRNCQPRKLNFYKNGDKEVFHISRINRTTARLLYRNFSEPRASVYCTAECPGLFQETLICGKDISSGYPPDIPDEVTCVIHEYSGNMTCTWNPGRLTHIDTKYVVHVKSLETEEEQQYITSSYINISTDSLRGGKKYLVWVQATNALGMEESQQLQIHLDDIVIPSASVITKAENINTTVPRTIVHWTSETTIEKVSCEMRYKATTNQTWNVKEFHTNFTDVQQSEFYLEPNIKYVFQVRCQETGKRYWQPWSSPFFHKTPEAVPQITPKSSQPGAHNSRLLRASIFKEHLTSDHKQDVGFLLGMVFTVTFSVLSLIGIFNRSLRTGIKRKIVLLMPKWLHEDIPNMENSNVAKMLQEQSDFINHNSSEQVLYVDPLITEIREIFLPEESKPTDYEQEKNTGSLETGDCPQNPLFASTTVVYIPDPNAGYKPQISNLLPGENHLSNNDDITSSTLKPPADSLNLEKNARLKKYPNFAFSISSINLLSNSPFLEELDLILNLEDCSPSARRNSAEETTTLLENDSPSETIPGQTWLSDELVSCLGIVNEELPAINPYFPQNILENHFNRISPLEK